MKEVVIGFGEKRKSIPIDGQRPTTEQNPAIKWDQLI
jgi:hypothetical protein